MKTNNNTIRFVLFILLILFWRSVLTAQSIAGTYVRHTETFTDSIVLYKNGTFLKSNSEQNDSRLHPHWAKGGFMVSDKVKGTWKYIESDKRHDPPHVTMEARVGTTTYGYEYDADGTQLKINNDMTYVKK